MTAEATAAERAAVDAVLGPPETAWEGGVRSAVDLRTARGPAETPTPLLPAPAAPPRGGGGVRGGGPHTRVGPPDGPPRRGLGRRDVLRDVQRGGAPTDRRACLRRP